MLDISELYDTDIAAFVKDIEMVDDSNIQYPLSGYRKERVGGLSEYNHRLLSVRENMGRREDGFRLTEAIRLFIDPR